MAILMIVYLGNRYFLKQTVTTGIIGIISNNYLNDFLGSMVFIGLTNVLVSLCIGSKKRIIRFLPTILFGCLCSICWEYIFPAIYTRGTTDIVDCVAYIFGSIFYWIVYLRREL